MTEIKKSPYEILIRWNCEPGEKFGQIRGVHLITYAYAVDDKGEIIGRVNRSPKTKVDKDGATVFAEDRTEDNSDDAMEFPLEDLPKYLGDRFVEFTKQLDEAKKEIKKRDEEISRIATIVADKEAHLEGEKELTNKHRIRADKMEQANIMLVAEGEAIIGDLQSKLAEASKPLTLKERVTGKRKQV